MKQYAVNIVNAKYNRPVGIIANNVKELKDILKRINSKFDKNEPKIEYLGINELNINKIITKHDPYEQIELLLELFLKHKDLYEIDTQKTLKLYASKEA